MTVTMCECCLPPVCNCCLREVERVRGSMWHGPHRLCDECFAHWYDSGETDSIIIGNYVRSKHGLGAIK